MTLHKNTTRTLQRLATCLAALCLAALGNAHAQQAAGAEAPAPAASQPASAPAAAPAPAASAPAAEPAVEEISLDIMEFVVEGNTVLPVSEIEIAVTPFLGPDRRFKDVELARKALEDAYQRIGYQTVFVDVPEQKVEGGVIRLRVAEGRVERTRVVGSKYYALGEIRRTASELAEGVVPDFNRLQTQLAQLNRSADRQVAPVLRPGRTPGTVEVELSVKDRSPLHGDVELNNRAAPFTTASRLNASLRYDNLWQLQHSAGITLQTSPQDTSEVKLLVGSYVWTLPDSGSALSFYALRSDSSVSLAGNTTVLGDATIAGARWIIPVRDNGAAQQSFSVGIDTKGFGQTKIQAGADTAAVAASIHYVPLTLGYSLVLPRPGELWQASLTLNTAPAGLFGNTDDVFQRRRAVARASYLAWKFEASHERSFGKAFTGFAKIDGQFTDSPLISNEQFALGGAESIRGYRESEIAGDRAFRGSAELRFHPFGQPSADQPVTAYALGFFEAGRVWLVNPQGPQQARSSIASFGFGLRVQGWRGFKFSADLALRDGLLGASGPVTARNDWRALFSAGYAF